MANTERRRQTVRKSGHCPPAHLRPFDVVAQNIDRIGGPCHGVDGEVIGCNTTAPAAPMTRPWLSERNHADFDLHSHNIVPRLRG
jgi:hypothetical protein